MPEDADKSARTDYTIEYTNLYDEKARTASTLSGYFAVDFKSFTTQMFCELPNVVKSNLRKVLRNKGVYVCKGRNVNIADALRQAVEDELKWPLDDFAGDHKDDTLNAKEKLSIENSSGAVTKNVFGISNLMKSYKKDEDCYSGLPTENFGRKIALFHERCDQAGVNEEDKPRAYSIILRGLALQHYFDALQGRVFDLIDLVQATRERFITPEYTRALIQQWDDTTLHTVMTSSRDKTGNECLEILVSKLQNIQSSLPTPYKREEILHNKLLNAVKNIEACKLAYFKPADLLSGLLRTYMRH